jgi:hypothetical protein
MKNYFVYMLPSAKKDISEARKWYKQYNEELPVRFKEELKLVVDALKLRPSVHAIRYKNIRLPTPIDFHMLSVILLMTFPLL